MAQVFLYSSFLNVSASNLAVVKPTKYVFHRFLNVNGKILEIKVTICFWFTRRIHESIKIDVPKSANQNSDVRGIIKELTQSLKFYRLLIKVNKWSE